MSNERAIDHAALARLQEWGGLELQSKMIGLFFENGRERVEAIRTGLEGEDLELAGRSAHSLRSSAGTLGARRVEGLAGRIETFIDGGSPDEAAALLRDLEHRFEECLEALEAHLSEDGASGKDDR